MRFGDGAWQMLPGVVPTYLTRVDAVEVSEREVTIHVFSRAEKARWATLAGAMFTVRITSPAEDVLRVQVTHHQGRQAQRVEYEIDAAPRPLAVTQTDGKLQVTCGKLQLVVDQDPWGLTFLDTATGAPLTSSPWKAMGLMHKPGHGLFLREQLTLAVGEQVYGLGERFAALCRGGQVIDMWNSDCGTCSDKGYKDVPFFLTSRGYGVFVNTPARVSFEIGTELVTRAQFAVPGEDLDYFLIRGPSPKEVLTKYGALTGRPALPPVWSFGLWLTTSFTTDYDEATVMSHVDGMAARNLPLHVFHFDCFWMKAHHWCDFRWDEAVFPDPAGMLGRLHAKGLRVCVWINPYVGERSHLFAEGRDRGTLLRRPNGDVFQRDQWQAGMAYVDFTNPDATRWYQEELRALVRMGVDAFKTDFGEEIPTDVAYFDGSDPALMHNYYTYLYNRAVFQVLAEERGAGEAAVFARSATATCQKFPVHWGGDSYGTYESMAESLRGGLSLALSGFGFWSHDIGGFETKSSPAVYKRWIAFGLLSSHSRLHGSNTVRVPWVYDEEAVSVLRLFTELKCRLMPYLMHAAVEAHRASIPVMRAMILEFPEDPTCRTLDRQYCLGHGLLVAPVFHDSRAEYYLPEGEWTHLLTGEVRAGGRWYFDEVGFLSVPVFVRPNAVVPMGPNSSQVDYDFAARVRLFCGRLDGKTPITVEIVDRRGELATRFAIEQDGSSVTVTNLDGRTDFEVELPWAGGIPRVEGGTASGHLVRATAARVTFTWQRQPATV
jgi:alpha-D-xyloside xylohydrolase